MGAPCSVTSTSSARISSLPAGSRRSTCVGRWNNGSPATLLALTIVTSTVTPPGSRTGNDAPQTRPRAPWPRWPLTSANVGNHARIAETNGSDWIGRIGATRALSGQPTGGGGGAAGTEGRGGGGDATRGARGRGGG